MYRRVGELMSRHKDMSVYLMTSNKEFEHIIGKRATKRRKLKKEILKSQNDTLVSQIDHAILKTYKDQLVFSFIGHYSAGKSSLINYLLEQDILPSSPVPTTSNTVAVQIGDDTEISAFLNQ